MLEEHVSRKGELLCSIPCAVILLFKDIKLHYIAIFLIF